MSKYDLDLDYAIPAIDITEKELNEIIVEADSIIAENSASPEKLAVAYLKKAQCLYKLAQVNDNNSSDEEKLYKAKELLEKALELAPDMPEVLMRLGTINSEISKNAEIEVSVNEENEELGPPISIEELENLPSFDDYLFGEAITMLTKAIQLKPDYAAAYNNRSNVFHNKCENHQDNLKKAIADLTEAIRIRPLDANYYLNRGQRYSELGEHEKAFCDFTSAITYGSDTFKKEFPIYNLHERAFQCVPENLKTPEMCLDVVKQNGLTLRFVPENLKTAELCLEAVKSSSKALNNLYMNLEATNHGGTALAYVPENLKTAELCLEAVRQDGTSLAYVPESLKTAQICFEAVKRLGWALQWVPENLKTPEMCLEAVKQGHGAALKDSKIWLGIMFQKDALLAYVPDNLKTPELCLEAVKHNGGVAFKYVPENLKTAEMCLEVVKQDGRALRSVPENLKTAELCLEAVKKSYRALVYVPETLKTAEVCHEAIKQESLALKHVPENIKTEDLCLEAIKRKGRAFKYVPENLKTAGM